MIEEEIALAHRTMPEPKLHIIYYAVLAIIVGIEFTYRNPLYDASIPTIIYIQKDITMFGRIVF